MNWVVDLADTFFNGRPARGGAESAPKPKQSAVTIAALIKRKSSVILWEGKLYRVTVEPAQVAK